MNPRLINWIWHIRGSVPLPSLQDPDESFDRLAPLFEERGTRWDRQGKMLTFSKTDQAPQDKMSVFDSGVLTIESGSDGRKLRYDLISRALLFCFLAPLLFLGIAQATVAISDHRVAAAKAEEGAHPKKDKPKKKPLPMSAFDKALGAPAPDSPDKKKPDEDKNRISATPAYVFASIFAALYIIGRILESVLIHSLFKRRLNGTERSKDTADIFIRKTAS